MPARSFWRSCCSISLVACRSQWAAAGITWSSVNSSPSYAERIFLFLICVYCSPENASIIWRRIGRPSKWSRAYSVSTSGNSRVSSHRIILFRILILCILSAICSRFGHHPRATLRRDSGSNLIESTSSTATFATFIPNFRRAPSGFHSEALLAPILTVSSWISVHK